MWAVEKRGSSKNLVVKSFVADMALRGEEVGEQEKMQAKQAINSFYDFLATIDASQPDVEDIVVGANGDFVEENGMCKQTIRLGVVVTYRKEGAK